MRALMVMGLAGALVLGAIRNQRRRISFAGKVVLISGGSRGLGLILARKLVSRGAKVAICARDPDELRRAQAVLDRQGGEAASYVCDITQKDRVEEMVGNVVSRFGAIDILINNASIIQVGPSEIMGEREIRAAMDTNFWGAVHLTQACLPWMKGQDGSRIVNITSIGAEIAVPHLLPYVCAKFAHRGYSLALAAELAEVGIRVVTVVPGLMRTGSFGNALFKGRRELEYAWFKLGSALPLISMDAERAAERIVEACRRGETVVTIGKPFQLARVVNGIWPGLVADLLGWINRGLPQPESDSQVDQETEPGWLHESALTRTVATRMGDDAAKRYNEVG